MINFPFSFTELMDRIGGLLRGDKELLSPIPEDPTPTPTPDPWVETGFTKAGGGYYKLDEDGRARTFVDKNKIPEDVLKQLEGSKKSEKKPEKKEPASQNERMRTNSESLSEFGDVEKLKVDYPILKGVAQAYGVPVEVLMAQYFQESSFGQNPSINKENEATALGPFQITRRTAEGGYPAFPDLKIDPNDRGDLGKSAEFAAKHYKYLSDYFDDPNKAISAYYGDPSYNTLIQGHIKNPRFQGLMDFLEGGAQ